MRSCSLVYSATSRWNVVFLTPLRDGSLTTFNLLRPCFGFVGYFSLSLILMSYPVECGAQPASGQVSSGGVGRYEKGEWGLVRGQFNNRSDQDQSLTAVVTQKSGSGTQFVRTVQIPAGTTRVAQWPLLVEDPHTNVYEFDYLLVDSSDGRETISRRENESILNSFSVPAIASAAGVDTSFWGHLYSEDFSDDQMDEVGSMLEALRSVSNLSTVVLNFDHEQIQGSPYALGPLGQLVVTSSQLSRFPQTCDSIRFWIQRGGRAVFFLDSTGEDTLRAVLGDALPFTVVDTTELLQFRMDNHEEAGKRTRQPSYDVKFDEPISMVRTIFEKGNVKWSQAGWPVIVELPVGRGLVYVLTMPARILGPQTGPEKLTPCATEILEQGFKNPVERALLPQSMLASVGQQQIGYSIPERWFPAAILSCFLVALAVISLFVTRRQQQTRLLIAVPLCAVLAMTPGVLTGMAARTTAPPTMIQTQVIQAATGQISLMSTGVATVYQPVPEKMDLTMRDHGSLAAIEDSAVAGRRRLVWSDNGTYSWEGFSQPVGVTSYNQTTILRLPEPLKALTSFEGDEVVVRLSNFDMLAPEDIVIAGPGADRMEARIADDGSLRSGPSDLLPPGELSNSTLLSERQLRRKELFNAVFESDDRLRIYPAEPTLLFWSEKIESSVSSSSETLRYDSSTLISLPLDIQMPEVGEVVSIPPTLLPYVVVADETGSVGSAYSNRQRRWMERKPGGSLVLKFQIPSECQPFHFENASVDLRIRAGSRTVKISVGQLGGFTDVTSLSSPVGNVTVDLPAEVLNAATDSGSILLNMSVGELEIGSAGDEQAAAEQDNFWKIDRVLLSLRGHRMDLPVTSNTENSK